jgi:serine protease Do
MKSQRRAFSSVDMRGAKILSILLLVVLASFACQRHGVAQTNFAPSNAAANAANDPGTVMPRASYADVVARVTPAVVTIRAERKVRAQRNPLMDDPMLRQFFGDRVPQMQPPQPQVQGSVGSGVIVSPDGYILTNNHVVEGGENIKVVLSDDRTLDAKIVGTDEPSDLAVLKVNASNLPVLPLGDSDKARVGDVVLAVGNPLDIGQTVTMGIISAKGRQTTVSNGTFEDFIQTDAPINQGNSGGALVNTNGELIGINSQIASTTGGSIGIGFAIPSNMARNVMEQLIKNGKVTRGQLGILVRKVDTDLAESLGLKDAHGVIVNAVTPGSAADKAGLKRYDVITAIDGTPVTDANSFRNKVAGTAPGTQVTLTVIRDGKEQQIRATLGEFKAENAKDNEGGTSGGKESTGKLGIAVTPLTPEMAQQLQLPDGTQGLLVRQVEPMGPASEAGIQEGDVIMEVNRQPVRSVDDLKAAVAKSGTRPILILVNHRGQTAVVTVRPR